MQTHREGLDRVAKELVGKEEISGKEVLELVGVEKSKSSLIRSETLENPLHLPLRDDSLCPKPLCLGFIEYSSERRPEEAIPVIQKAIRISPSAHHLYASLGAALRMTGRFEEAVSAFKKAIQLEPDNVGSHIELAATYSLMGREKEAHAEAAEVLGINPKFSLDSYAKMVTYKDQSEADKLIDALRKAGLKGAIEAKFSAICTFLPVIVDPQRHLRL